ncbi:hypothetical protein HWV62_40826 [Athelia sp. TMB]|nr:hypothetical protein HWV62_40826 [Athelia sp. TMB]
MMINIKPLPQQTYPVVSMDCLPVELCERIFILSCIDNRSAACSLSRVSKSIRALTAPFRYHTVAIKSLASALHFVELLDTSPKGSIRVSNLYFAHDTLNYPHICYISRAIEGGVILPQSRTRRLLAKLLPKKYKGLALKKLPKQKQTHQRRDIVAEALESRPRATEHSLTIDAIRRILEGVADNLITLSIAHRHRYHWLINSLEIPHLPRLKELAVTIRVLGCNCNGMSSLYQVLSRLPSLQRLDLSGMHRFDAQDDVILGAVAHFNHLTHICLPVVGSIHSELAGQNVDRALRILSDDSSNHPTCNSDVGLECDPPVAPLQVVIMVDPSWDVNVQGWHMREVTPLTPESREACLVSLRECAKQHRGRLTIHQRSTFRDSELEEQEQIWRDRVTGGAGRWRENDGLVCKADGA